MNRRIRATLYIALAITACTLATWACVKPDPAGYCVCEDEQIVVEIPYGSGLPCAGNLVVATILVDGPGDSVISIAEGEQGKTDTVPGGDCSITASYLCNGVPYLLGPDASTS